MQNDYWKVSQADCFKRLLDAILSIDAHGLYVEPFSTSATSAEGGLVQKESHLEGGVIQLGWLQGVRPHVDSPVPWVYDVVVDDAEVAVERLRLILVLNHSWL